jgi:hypothetical protein
MSKKVKAANRKRRESKRKRQAEEMAVLRSEVFARANGKGELCGKPLFMIYGELCHLDGGIGRRRQKQSIENCVAEHLLCHFSLDKRPTSWIPRVKEWCSRYGYPVPERFRILEAKQLQQEGMTNGGNKNSPSKNQSAESLRRKNQASADIA